MGNRHIIIEVAEECLDECLEKMHKLPTEDNRKKLLGLLEGTANISIDGDINDPDIIKDRWDW
jgi:hypothetical protein